MPKGIPKEKLEKSLTTHARGCRQKRAKIEAERDIWYAVNELAKGATYREISDYLNEHNDYAITPQQVAYDIHKAMVEWKRENMSNIEGYIATEVARLEQIEQKILKDYEHSKVLRPNEYAALMKRGMSVEEIDEMYKTRPLAGNPAFLDTLLRLQKQRLQLLGIDKGSDVPQNTVIQYNFGGLSDDALAKIADVLQDTKSKEILTTLSTDNQ